MIAGSPPKAFAAFRKAELDRRWASAHAAVAEYLGPDFRDDEATDVIELVRHIVERSR